MHAFILLYYTWIIIYQGDKLWPIANNIPTNCHGHCNKTEFSDLHRISLS